MSLLLKVLISADFGLVCLGIVPLSQKSLDLTQICVWPWLALVLDKESPWSWP